MVRPHELVRQSMARDKLNVTALAETNNWCTAAHLASIMAGARESVLNELRNSPMTLPLARRLHDALLGCFMIGWLPPQRPSCVRTLLSPFHRGPCMDPDCRKPQECQDNRILRHADGQMSVELKHHKMSTSGVAGPSATLSLKSWCAW